MANKTISATGSERTTLALDDWMEGETAAGVSFHASLTNLNKLLRPRNVASHVVTATSSSSSAIPADDTIPQSGEGTQILTAGITPTSLTSKIRARAVVHLSASAVGAVALAMFNGGASAVRAQFVSIEGVDHSQELPIEYEWVPGSLTAITVSVRYGPLGGFTAYINGGGGTRYLGGVVASQLFLEEVHV